MTKQCCFALCDKEGFYLLNYIFCYNFYQASIIPCLKYYKNLLMLYTDDKITVFEENINRFNTYSRKTKIHNK